MTRLSWDKPLDEYRTGLDHGVIYPKNSAPVVWNGLISIAEEVESGESKTYYYDGQAYVKQRESEGFTASVEAVTYPDLLDTEGEVDLSYRVQTPDGYQIHLVYNAKLVASEIGHSTIDDTTDLSTFKWTLTTVPEKIDSIRATAHVVISTTDSLAEPLATTMDLLYGTDGTQARMPPLQELMGIYEDYAVFIVVDNGDGTWTATGPDSWFEMLDATTFRITSPSAIYLDAVTYQLSNW